MQPLLCNNRDRPVHIEMEGFLGDCKWKNKTAEQCIKYETVVWNLKGKNKQVPIFYKTNTLNSFYKQW